jgi:hypothetical protein
MPLFHAVATIVRIGCLQALVLAVLLLIAPPAFAQPPRDLPVIPLDTKPHQAAMIRQEWHQQSYRRRVITNRATSSPVKTPSTSR